jgi:hypothetical protein
MKNNYIFKIKNILEESFSFILQTFLIEDSWSLMSVVDSTCCFG